MSVKWTATHSESGILRKSEIKEKKEELFVFGYSCKLFRDDDKALHIDQGKHLIPWMGDESLKIDRYDARGALHDLTPFEAPPGGYDWRIELTKNEQDVEQLCDEERYRAVHTDEDEEEMYKEEELKRLHAAGYGQVGFNYDAPIEPTPESQPVEVDEPFLPTTTFKALLPTNVVVPETQKQNAIIEKTAKFIASQGVQMEILIKAKQGDNPQFQFLNKDSVLHGYYTALIALVKSGKWPENKPEAVEDKNPEIMEEYLHPSLASTIIESAPSIPSIQYRPSADCDYTLLVSRLRGSPPPDEACGADVTDVAPGELPPPGTRPLPPRADITRAPVMYARPGQRDLDTQASHQNPYQQYAAYYQQYLAQAAAQIQAETKPAQKHPPVISPTKSTGLSLMKNYNTDSDSDESDFDDTSSTDSKEKTNIVIPPEDVQLVIDKMATYVARNGDEFAEIVRAKKDPRLTFLEPDNIYHAYYKKLMQEKRGIDVNGKRGERPKSNAMVSFSIKKHKEPDPILPKPALPYESSSDDESETAKQEKTEEIEKKEPPKIMSLDLYPYNNIPPPVVYKIEGTKYNDTSIVKSTVPTHIVKQVPVLAPPIATKLTEVAKPLVKPVILQEYPSKPVQQNTEKIEDKKEKVENKRERVEIKKDKVEDKKDRLEEKKARLEEKKEKVEEKREKVVEKKETPEFSKLNVEISRSKARRRDSPDKKDKRKHEHRKDYNSRKHRESRRTERNGEKERREKENEREKKKKNSKEEVENEIISLEDNSDDLIDLTGEQSDSKVECETEAERVKQQERRKRAAEFLKKVGVDPAAAALPTTSLASAMVDTLESIRKKKAEDEEKRRRREKRKRRDKHYDDESDRHGRSKRRKYRSSDEENSDNNGSKKKKRKKDKKNSSRDKRKRRKEIEAEEDVALPINIDLTNTLKELRTSSPTKELGLDKEIKDNPILPKYESSDEDFEDEKDVKDKRKRKKEDREYSEGEWSSDSNESSSTDKNT